MKNNDTHGSQTTAIKSEVFCSLSKLSNKTTSSFQYFLLLFIVALLFQIKHSPHKVFLQTAQCTGWMFYWAIILLYVCSNARMFDSKFMFTSDVFLHNEHLYMQGSIMAENGV